MGGRVGALQPLDDARGDLEVLLGHQVRVGVVVDDGRVLVGPGHAVDAEAPAAALGEEPEPHPEARGLDQHLGALVEQEPEVARDAVVLVHRVGDVGVDVVLRGAGRVPRRGLLAVDRAPRIERARVADLLGAAARRAEHPDAEVERLPGPLGVRVDEERQDVDLGVPEVVALVAVAGHALGRHAEALAARRGLQQLEEVEAHGLLEVGRALEPDVAAAPEVGDPARRARARSARSPRGGHGRACGRRAAAARRRAPRDPSGRRRTCAVAAPRRRRARRARRPGRRRPRAVVSTVTGEAASMSWSIPHAISSPLVRVARCRRARRSTACAAIGSSTFSVKPLPRRGSSLPSPPPWVTSSEEMSMRTAASSATTS